MLAKYTEDLSIDSKAFKKQGSYMLSVAAELMTRENPELKAAGSNAHDIETLLTKTELRKGAIQSSMTNRFKKMYKINHTEKTLSENPLHLHHKENADARRVMIQNEIHLSKKVDVGTIVYIGGSIVRE